MLPIFLRMLFHLYLIVILGDFVPPYLWQTGVFDEYACSPVLLDVVGFNERLGEAGSEDAASLILLDSVASDHAHGLHQHDAVVVGDDLVLLNQQLVLPLHHEDALRLGALDDVVLDLGQSRVLTAQSHVRLDVLLYLVRKDLSARALHYQDALVVVRADDV